MKIINKTEDEMVLKGGGQMVGMIGGGIFVIAGAYFAITSLSSGSIGWFILFPILFIVVGVVLFLLGSSTIVSIYKSRGIIQYDKKRLIGIKTSEYNISDVMRVELRKEWQTERVQGSQGSSSTTRQVLVSQMVLMFKTGVELALGNQKSSMGMRGTVGVLMGGQAKEIALANQIADFLGVPFQEIAPPDRGFGIDLNSIGKILN